jgi:hypothetical protein
MFGSLYPRKYCESNAAERWKMQTQCLVEGTVGTTVEVEVRFLHLVARQVAQSAEPSKMQAGDAGLTLVDTLKIDGEIYESWQEAVERQVRISSHAIGELLERSVGIPVAFRNLRDKQDLRDSQGALAGAIVRERLAIRGLIELSARRIADGLFSISVTISNLSSMEALSSIHAVGSTAQLQSFVSTHTILACEAGRFVSLIDPPPCYGDVVSQIRNESAWPVLVGAEGSRSMMLSSPIILYDYPQIAVESSGDHFDATEIDEMLALRVITMTDDEKCRMHNVDDRAREILRRTEVMPEEQLQKLHGAIRGLRKLQPTIE